MADSFPYKTQPFEHQREALRLSAHRAYFALFMEQGTGKTKIIIDTVAWLYLKERIDGLVIIAPNNVHRNWIDDQIPEHMSDEVGWRSLIWRAHQAGTKYYLRAYKDLLRFPGLSILALNIEALRTDRGNAAAKNFLRLRKCLLAIDESQDMRSAKAKQTGRIRTLGKYAPYRRIASGTPSPEGPFDLYPQMQFLSPDILRCGSAVAFRHTYAEMRRMTVPGQKRPFEIVVRDEEGMPKFKNLNQLNAKIAPHSFRVRKADVFDLPPKLWTKRYYELSVEQARMYREMYEQFQAAFPDGETVTVDIKLVQYLRLQQIAHGYVPVDGDDPDPERVIPGPQPRLELLMYEFEKANNATAIWTRYRYDANLIVDALSKKGYSVVRYDGAVKDHEKDEAKRRFQAGEAQALVINAAAGGRGLTITAAETAIYYGNYFGYEKRAQSEDRHHRAGLKHSVLYIDLIAEGTIDQRIITALRSKKNVSDIIMADPESEWI